MAPPQQQIQQQFQKLKLAHPQSPPRYVIIERTPSSKEEINGSNIPSENYWRSVLKIILTHWWIPLISQITTQLFNHLLLLPKTLVFKNSLRVCVLFI